VFYCQPGWCSALATKALKDMGFDNVMHFAGGFEAWKDSDDPILEKPTLKK